MAQLDEMQWRHNELGYVSEEDEEKGVFKGDLCHSGEAGGEQQHACFVSAVPLFPGSVITVKWKGAPACVGFASRRYDPAADLETARHRGMSPQLFALNCLPSTVRPQLFALN